MFEAMVAIFGVVGVVAVGCLSAKAGQFHERRRWERRLLEQSGFRLDVGVRSIDAKIPGDARLERLENAVDAIAIEMERVSEGQRFVTRLLSERRTERTPPSPIPGVVKSTPRPTN